MSNADQSYKQKEIYGRIDNFVFAVLDLVKTLTKNPINQVLIYQLIKSATSIGANAREAQASQTKIENL